MWPRRLAKHAFMMGTITAASWLPLFLLAARILYTGRPTYLFLVWNLFLAWVPLGVAWLLHWRSSGNLSVWLFIGLWLLFFPNAPYLVTDLIHLQYVGQAPIWYDALMMFTFALVGLFWGLVSLALVQGVVSSRCGRGVGWVFALGSLGLTGVGIMIGRFLRWNSWDVFLQPLSLLQDLLWQMSDPAARWRLLVAAITISLMLLVAYLLLQTARLVLATLPSQ